MPVEARAGYIGPGGGVRIDTKTVIIDLTAPTSLTAATSMKTMTYQARGEHIFRSVREEDRRRNSGQVPYSPTTEHRTRPEPSVPPTESARQEHQNVAAVLRLPPGGRRKFRDRTVSLPSRQTGDQFRHPVLRSLLESRRLKSPRAAKTSSPVVNQILRRSKYLVSTNSAVAMRSRR